MEKKILLAIVSMIIGLNGLNAQTFSKGEKAIAASVSNLDLGLVKMKEEKIQTDFNLGLKGDYFVIDNLTITAGFSFGHLSTGKGKDNWLLMEIGSKYYFWKYLYGGIFYQGLYDNARLNSAGKLEVGATVYIAQNVFIEPAIYFLGGERAFKSNNITSYTQFGLGLSFGMNF